MNDEVTEKGVIAVTPDSSKLNSATRRYLKSKANTSAPPSLTNSEEVPNYLRASTGSCHDFCKYGRKHDSEPKKRRPIFPSFFGIHQTTNEEYKARVPVLRGRKKLEVKLKQLKNEASSGSKASKQKDLSPATVIIPFARADESSEDMLSISSAGLAEGSLEVPVSIKVMVLSPSMEPVACGTAYQAGFPEEPVDYGLAYQAGLSEEVTALNNSTTSPTIKNIVAAEHIPLTYGSSEYTFARTIGRSTEEPRNIALMPPSPFEESIASPPNEVGSSSKNSIRKAVTSDIEESRLADVATRTTEGSISMKPRNKLPVQKISVLAKHVPYSRASEKFVTSKLKSRSPIKNTDLTAKHVPGSRARKSSEDQQQVTRVGSSVREKRLTELKGARQSQKVVSVRDEVVKQRKIDASGQPNIVKRKTLSPVKKATVSVEPKQTKLKSPTSFKRSIVSGLPKIIKQKATSPPKGVYVKPKTSMLKSTSSVVSSTGLTNQRIQENRSSLTQLGDKKLLRTSRSSVTPNPVNRVASMKLKDRAKVTKREPGTEIVKEKTLYMVEPKQVSIDLKRVSQKPRKHEASLSPRFSSSPTSSKDEQSDCNSVFSEACGLVSATKQRSKKPAAAVPRVENMEKLRRSSPVGSVDKKPLAPYKLKRNVTVGVVDNKPPSPHKLKFRRGKIINLQPESSGPRRLRFRTVRAVSENQSEVMRRSFRKRRESSSPVMDSPAPEAPPLVIRKRRETSSAVMDPPVSEATPTVVLRHQDVQGRKDTQGLFNNVIEETAKQLVEARKSKVKALVGAFETVISLQEK